MTKPVPAQYRTTNWKDYNAALKARGSLSVWLGRDMVWLAPSSGRPSRPTTFSDAAIQFCLTIKGLFGLVLRQVIGFVQSLIALAGLDWPVPDYSTGVYWKKTEAVAQQGPSTTDERTPVAELSERLDGALQRLNQIAIRQLIRSMVKHEIVLSRYSAMGDQLAEKEAAILSLTQKLQDKMDVIAQLYNSQSWRVTAPLRKLTSLFRRAGNGQ